MKIKNFTLIQLMLRVVLNRVLWASDVVESLLIREIIRWAIWRIGEIIAASTAARTTSDIRG